MGQCISHDTSKCYIKKPFPIVDFSIEKKYDAFATIALYQSPLLADMDGDCKPDIIAAAGDANINNPRVTKDILIVNSLNGTVKTRIATPYYSWQGMNAFAVADIDGDGKTEIFLATSNVSNSPTNSNKIICYNNDGTLRWLSDQQYGLNVSARTGGSIGLADFNQDGTPEVYIFNEIFNAKTGVKLADGGSYGNGISTITGTSGTRGISVAAYLDDDNSDLELAAGYSIYKVKLTNINGTQGNTMIAQNLNLDGAFRDGYTSIADINQDGKLDVIVASDGSNVTARLYVYTLENGSPKLIAKTTPIWSSSNGVSPTRIGPPFVGDIDGSGKPSIGITRPSLLVTYKYNNTENLQQTWALSTNDQSGNTGMTMFDFNQDGVQEIVYRDETTLRIINGKTNPPQNLASIPCLSNTGSEYPIVGDLQNSGQSSICVPCGTTNGLVGTLSFFGARSSGQQWAPSRGIWNQYGYHVTNISDDLTVPRVQNNHASFNNKKFNNFFVQASLIDESGSFLLPGANLAGKINCVTYDAQKDKMKVIFDLESLTSSSFNILNEITVAFKNAETNQSLGIFKTGGILTPGEILKNKEFFFDDKDVKNIRMEINPLSPTAIDECDKKDNIDTFINVPTLNFKNQFVCFGKTHNFFGQDYSKSGTYTNEIKNRLGCDSIIHVLKFSVGDTTNRLNVIKACDSYGWLGQNYTNSGVFTKSYTTSQGCPTTDTLKLDIAPSSTIKSSKEACDTYIWYGEKLYKSGQYNQKFKNIYGCDSTQQLQLTVFPSYQIIDNVKAKEEYVWPVNNVKYEFGGEAMYKTTSIYGCDSIHVLKLDLSITPVLYFPNVLRLGSLYKFKLFPNRAITEINYVRVYDRWGNIVWAEENYDPKDPEIGWDGFSKDKKNVIGVYTWVANLKLYDNSVITKSGDVTLVE